VKDIQPRCGWIIGIVAGLLMFDPFGVVNVDNSGPQCSTRLNADWRFAVKTPNRKGRQEIANEPNAFRCKRKPGSIDRKASTIRTPQGFNINSTQFNMRPNPEGVECLVGERTARSVSSPIAGTSQNPDVPGGVPGPRSVTRHHLRRELSEVKDIQPRCGWINGIVGVLLMFEPSGSGMATIQGPFALQD
jgi:hypothetical protein